jgi:hypothetical protein
MLNKVMLCKLLTGWEGKRKHEGRKEEKKKWV